MEKTKFVSKAFLPSKFGKFDIYAFTGSDGKDHVALVSKKLKMAGNRLKDAGPVLVRIHSKCLTGDTLGSLRCDCRAQLEASLKRIDREGGILVYLDQEGRGIGLVNKIKAYALQERGMDTVEANEKLGFPVDMRTYEIAGEMLKQLGVNEIRLITNNPKKLDGLEDGLHIVERVPLNTKPNRFNKAYMETKRKRMGHLYENR